jgi:uracil-DNA glycosylase family 4
MKSPSSSSEASKRYEELVKQIRECRKCDLYRYRKNPVVGEGPLTADIMLIGEAPGRKEDETGRPFVGPAGQLLNVLLAKAGLKREEVYITNVVKCRPPGNRDPTKEEISACLPYLIAQLEIIEPKLIITLGRHAGRVIYNLLGRPWRGMSSAHGVLVEGALRPIGLKAKVIATYHPAAALYNPQIRAVLEEDFTGPIRMAVEATRSGGSVRKSRSLLDFMDSSRD